MKVPVYQRSVAQAGLPNVKQSINVSASDFINTNAFVATKEIGGMLNNAERAYYDIQQQQQQLQEKEAKEANYYRSQSALNQYKTYVQEAQYGENGWANQRGDAVFKQANNKPLSKSVMDGLMTKRQDILKELGNEEQRALFGLHADDIDTHVNGQLLGHEAEQYRVFKRGVNEAGMATAAQDIQLNYNDLALRKKAIDEITAHSINLSNLEGYGEEYGRAKAKSLISESLKTGAYQALQNGDTSSAQAIIDNSGDYLEAKDKISMQGSIGDSWAASTENTNPQLLVDLLGTDALERALLMTESGGRNYDKNGKPVKSNDGAGSMFAYQTTTATARDPGYGIKPAQDDSPEERNRVGHEYYLMLKNKYGGDPEKILAAYNAGPGAVDKAIKKDAENWKDFIPADTREKYIPRTLARMKTGTPADGMDEQDRLKWLSRAQNKIDAGRSAYKIDLVNEINNQYAQVSTSGVTGISKTLEDFERAYGQNAQAAFTEYQDNLDFNRSYFGMKDMPAAKAQALLAEAKPKVGEDTAEFAREQKQYDHLKQAYEHADKIRQADPIAYAYQSGMPVNPINWDNPDQAAEEVTKRMHVSDRMSADYGTQPSIMTKQEQDDLGNTFNAMSTESALQFMETLNKGTSRETYELTMQQFSKNSPVTALAGGLYGVDSWYNETTFTGGNSPIHINGQKAAKYILRGERLLNPAKGDKEENMRANKLLMPKEIDLKHTFDTKTNGAFAGMSEAASFTYQAVNAAYAGLSDEVGDTSGVYNNTRYIAAMEMVTGSKDGAIDAFNSKIIPPYGMPEDVFIDRVDTEFKRQIEVNNLPIDPSMINDYKIIPLDYGVYGFVDGNDVKPVVVNLNTVQSLMP